MKKLVVIGASLAALAIAVWLVRSQPAGDASTANSSQPASPSPPPPAARESADLANDAKPPEPVVLAPAVESAGTTGARPAPIDEQRAQPTAAARSDEAQQLAECRAMWEREHRAEQVARASETKDSGWAYPTEQKLREYLSRRFETIPVEVIGIDCRTTFCEVKAQSFVPEGAQEFQTALAEVGRESWNDFTGSSFSQTEEASPVLYTGEVRRRGSYAATYQRHDDPKQIACATLVGAPVSAGARCSRCGGQRPRLGGSDGAAASHALRDAADQASRRAARDHLQDLVLQDQSNGKVERRTLGPSKGHGCRGVGALGESAAAVRAEPAVTATAGKQTSR